MIRAQMENMDVKKADSCFRASEIPSSVQQLKLQTINAKKKKIEGARNVAQCQTEQSHFFYKISS